LVVAVAVADEDHYVYDHGDGYGDDHLSPLQLDGVSVLT
jgi:hypothetical protein